MSVTSTEPSERITARRLVVIGLLYLALTVALLEPFSLHLSSRAFSPGSDWNFTLWVFAWNVHSFLHQPWHIFDANIMAPLSNTLGFEENGIGSAMLVAPIIWLTHDVNLAANVADLLTIPLSGLGVYVLARKLRVSEPGSILAGLVFALEPPRFFRFEQFHVTAIEWIPFCLAYLHDYLDRGRRRDLWIALAFFSAQAVTSGHGTAFLLVAIVALLAYRLILGESMALLQRVRDGGVVGALLLTPAVLIYLPYHRARAEAGLERNLQGWFTAPASFLATPSRIDSAIVAHFPTWLQESPNAYLFPGYLVLLFLLIAWCAGPRVPAVASRLARWLARAAVLIDVVALGFLAAAIAAAWLGLDRLKVGDTVVFTVRHAWRPWLFAAGAIALRLAIVRGAPLSRPADWWPALVAWRRTHRQDAAWFYAILAVGAAALLLGPPLGPWQFVYWIPPLSFIRAPLRFSLLVVLGLAVLCGIALDRLTARRSASTRAALALAAGMLFVIEFAAVPLDGYAFTMDIPAIDRWLDTLPKPFTIAEVPIATPGDVSLFNAESARYMVHSIAHFQKTVMGFTGVLPPDHAQLFDEMSHFPDDASLRHLLEYHVTYVVVHGDDYSPEDYGALAAGLHRYSAWLTPIHAMGKEAVYSLHPPPSLAIGNR